MKRIDLIFRLDDISAISDGGFEAAVLDVFSAHQAKLLVAVVPFVGAMDGSISDGRALQPFTGEKVEMIRRYLESGVAEVALHGYSHFSRRGAELTEFAGVEFESQRESLAKGEKYLRDLLNVPITIFVPPFNSYDKNTIRALDDLGFKVMSGGIYGPAASDSKMHYMPATCGLRNLRAAVEAAREAADRSPMIVALFHHYDFREVDQGRGTLTLEELDSLLAWVSKQADVRVVSMGEAVGEHGEDLSVRRFIAVEKWRLHEALLPGVFREQKPVLYYHEAEVLRRLAGKIGLIYGALAILTMGVAFWGGGAVGDFFPRVAEVGSWVGAASVLAIGAYAGRNLQFAPKGLAATSAALGAWIGFLCRYLGA